MKHILTLVVFLLSASVFAKDASCTYKDATVTVTYEHEVDYQNTCVALEKLYEFAVNEWHFKMDTIKPHIDFKENVILPSAAKEWTGIRVFGYYNSDTHGVEMTTSKTNWVNDKKRTFFKLRYTNDLHISVIAHELTHAYNKEQYRTKRKGHSPDEYMAYVLQISTMPESLRNKVLNHKDNKGQILPGKGAVNDFMHAVDPHGFGISAYNHYHSADGGKAFVDEILDGQYTGELMDI